MGSSWKQFLGNDVVSDEINQKCRVIVGIKHFQSMCVLQNFSTYSIQVGQFGPFRQWSVRITDIAVPNWPYRTRTDKLIPGARLDQLKLKWFPFVSAWPVALIINDRALCQRGNFISPAPQKRKLMFPAVPKIAHHITRFFITLSLEWVWVMIA